MASDGAVIYTIQGDNSQFNADLNKSKTLATASAVAIGTAFVDMSKRVASAISSAIAMGMDYNAQMETYQTSFETMLGSAEQAADLMEQIKQKAASTPFETEDLTAVTQLLMNYGLTAEDAIDKMNMLGDISQGNADKMMRIATAYGQMSSAGRVTLEDINQMIEAGFSPLQEISESTGESIASLRNRISEGTLSVDEITESMKRSTSQGGKYFQSMDKQSKTFSGQLSTMKDNANSFLGAMTSGLFEIGKSTVLPKLNKELESLTKSAQTGQLKKSMDKLTTSLGNMATKGIDTVSKALPKVIDAVAFLAENFDTLAGAAGVAIASFAAFKTVKTVGDVVKKFSDAWTTAIAVLNMYPAATAKTAISSAALSGALSAQEIAVAGLSGKISIATAVQGLWNAAMAANPAGTIAVAVGALIAVIGALTIAFNSNESAIQKQKKAIEETTAEVDDFVTSSENAKEEFKDNLHAIEDQTVSSKALIDRLDELEKQTNRTAGQQQEMQGIIDQLNSLYPDLNLQIDKQTGSLNIATEALNDYVEANENVVKLNYYQEEHTRLIQEAEENTRLLAEAQEELSTKENEYMESLPDWLVTMMSWNGATKDIANNYLDAKNNVDELTSKQQENAEAQEYYGEKIVEYSDIVGNASNTLGEYADTQQQVIVGGYDMTAAIQSSGISAEEAQEKFDTYAESTQNAFERIKDNVKLTADEMINNLNANQTRISEWTTNLGILADRGLDSGLLQALRELGPEAAVTVENLANTSSDKLQLLNDAYARGGDMAANALLTELGLPEVTGAGGATIEAVADSMVNGTDSTQEAARTVVHDIRSTLNETVENTSFSSVGYNICAGVADGIKSGRSRVEYQAKLMAKSAYNAAKKELDIHSPSKAFDKLARFIPQGVAKGIETDTPKAEKATEEMSQKLITVAGLKLPIYKNGSYATSPTIHIPEVYNNISLTGDINMDGFKVGDVVLRNLDDVAAFRLRG